MQKIINGDSLEILKTFEDNSVDSIVTDPPYGISFMGKKWDYDVPQVELWQEVLRVLKPGGHALVACGTRTQHRMAVNLEDAGFEIRDIVAWVYGSGFPKSLNIGKAVDKLQGNEREVVGKDENPERFKKYKEQDGNERKTFNEDITKGNSPYEGWGTALKPAMELWTLCRKPLEEKTVAENVLKYGTGGVNIDGCRVGTDKHIIRGGGQFTKDGEKTFFPSNEINEERIGRFPANLIHDGSDEVVGLFPYTKGGTAVRHNSGGKTFGGEIEKPAMEDLGYGDSGSASRFFYCAKASKSERNKGLGEIEKGNNHPTVKPISLMRYLCKLITPVGGTILDPFTGSGSTGIGAKLEGFDFIGIELDPEYCKIAEVRINHLQ